MIAKLATLPYSELSRSSLKEDEKDFEVAENDYIFQWPSPVFQSIHRLEWFCCIE